ALQLGSGGWFLVHILAANANAWDRRLAYGFWHDQMLILWPLVAAGALSCVWKRCRDAKFCVSTAPIYYTLFGAIVAIGVGKVGAYANYFLEFYVGLIWLAAAVTKDEGRRTKGERRPSFVFRL